MDLAEDPKHCMVSHARQDHSNKVRVDISIGEGLFKNPCVGAQDCRVSWLVMQWPSPEFSCARNHLEGYDEGYMDDRRGGR